MEAFAVLAPLGRPARAALTRPPRLTSLDGRRVAFVWDEIFRGDEMFAVIAQELTARWPRVEFVGHEHFGNPEQRDGTAVIEALPGRLRAHRIDAVIAGVGA
jgi:hypothetical protein